MLTFHKLIYKFNTVLIKISARFCKYKQADLDKYGRAETVEYTEQFEKEE